MCMYNNTVKCYVTASNILHLLIAYISYIKNYDTGIQNALQK